MLNSGPPSELLEVVVEEGELIGELICRIAESAEERERASLFIHGSFVTTGTTKAGSVSLPCMMEFAAWREDRGDIVFVELTWDQYKLIPAVQLHGHTHNILSGVHDIFLSHTRGSKRGL